MIYIMKIKRLRLKFRVKEKRKKDVIFGSNKMQAVTFKYLFFSFFNVLFFYLKISVDSNGARTSF